MFTASHPKQASSKLARNY